MHARVSDILALLQDPTAAAAVHRTAGCARHGLLVPVMAHASMANALQHLQLKSH